MALRWEDIDLQKNVIIVSRSWDVKAGMIEPKSHAGRRTVPIASVLREHLIAYQLRSGRRDGLVFGATRIDPSPRARSGVEPSPRGRPGTGSGRDGAAKWSQSRCTSADTPSPR